MRAIITSFDSITGDATACRVVIYNAQGRNMGSYQTRWYKSYPRLVRAATDAENFARTWASKRLLTLTIERS